jgi:uncharacterized protein YceK
MKLILVIAITLLASGCAAPVCHIEAAKDKSLSCAGIEINGVCHGGYQRTGSLMNKTNKFGF